MKKWKVIGKRRRNIIKTLLENRGLKTKKEIEEFLNPKLNHVTINHVAIDRRQLKKAVARIKKAIKKQEQIIVYGDYDVDGICGTAILWETLNALGANTMPYIPHRIDEGYGLSIKGIENITRRYTLDAQRSLIITVDNGIVASDAVEFANKAGIDVIITDHHVPGKKLPKAYSIVHTTKLCGAGVAWALAQQLTTNNLPAQAGRQLTTHLELVALATIADLVPLLGANRTLTKYGLRNLRETKRVGLLALFKEAGLEKSEISTYEVGHIIAPRLNAMGRIESALDSLRLICTKDQKRAMELAYKLGSTNRKRQLLTEEMVLHAKSTVNASINSAQAMKKLLFISHESYQQGVIGLVAGKLVEEFYRPTIVVSKGEKLSRASARSVHGFNIIEFIREASEHLIDAGGHPMAAGFTVETAKLTILQKIFEEGIAAKLDEALLTRTLRIDCEIDFSLIKQELYKAIKQFEPFGMHNPEPTFITHGATIEDMRLVGKDGKHIKLKVESGKLKFDAIAFSMGERVEEFRIGDAVDIVYTIDKDEWHGNHRLQLKIKDMRLSKKAN